MTTTHPSPLMEDPYATHGLPMTSDLWVAAMVNFDTSPTDLSIEQQYMEWKWNGSQHRREQYHG